VSYVDDLIATYEKFVGLPWPQSVAPPQRVWMAVYPPKHERRMRLNLKEFENATIRAGHSWSSIDITNSFETWMAQHEYSDAYFDEPELLDSALPAFFEELVAQVRVELDRYDDPAGVVGLVGAGALFGLGDSVKVSALMSEVNASIAGRLLVFFPGSQEQNNWRLLDARDGWDYMAVAITSEGARR
jgi:hypothetical protein